MKDKTNNNSTMENIASYILQALLLISSATYAQNTLRYQTNSLRPDSVGKEVINFIEPGCSGLEVLYINAGGAVYNNKVNVN